MGRCVPCFFRVSCLKGVEMAGSVWVRLKRQELFLKFRSFVKKKMHIQHKQEQGKGVHCQERGAWLEDGRLDGANGPNLDLLCWCAGPEYARKRNVASA